MLRKIAVLWILSIILSACQPINLALVKGTSTPIEALKVSNPSPSSEAVAVITTTSIITTPRASITSTDSLPSPTYTVAASQTPQPNTPTPTLTVCMKAGGKVEVYEFTTVLLPDPLVYRIYLPPCYDEQPEQAYPVLYLIHGQTFNDDQWDRLGVPEVADRLIASGEVAPFIVVMPRDRVWTEPTVDNFGLAVEQSLIPWIDEHYRTLPDRAHRAIGGLSRGAAWAVHIGIKNWELFSIIGVHSGFVFHSDVQPIYQWLNSIPEGMAPRVYMDIGNADRPEISTGAKWLEGLLTRYDIPHEWHMFVGEHDEEYWKAHLEDYLRWYTLDWNQ